MIDETMIIFIKEVGVPVVAFVMMYALYVQNQKWQQKQTEKTEERFDKLSSSFLVSIKEITDLQNKTLEKHTAVLERNTVKLDEQSAKLVEQCRKSDEFMEYIKEDRRTHG